MGNRTGDVDGYQLALVDQVSDVSLGATEGFGHFGDHQDCSTWKCDVRQGELRRCHFLCHCWASISESKAGFFAISSYGPDEAAKPATRPIPDGSD